MDGLSTERLARLIAQRCSCLQQLYALSRAQGELVVAERTEDLLRLLAAKQQLLNALQQTERELKPFQGQDPLSRQWSSPESHRRCAADAEQCRRLLADLMTLERSAEQQAIENRNLTAEKIQSLAASDRVRSAYLTNAGTAGVPAPHVGISFSPPVAAST